MRSGIILLLVLSASAALAAVERCGFQRHYQEQLRKDPSRAGRVSQALGTRVPDDGSRLVIPVKVHVLYNTQDQNISDEQINSQFVVLNQDYGGTNNDKSYALPMFQEVTGTANIQFVLDSISRTQVSRASWYDSNDVPGESGVAPVEPDRFLNIWVVNQGGPKGPQDSVILGYACLPPCPPASDGIVMDHRAFGQGGTTRAPYNLGRTVTHEMGHYLGLWHTFGEEPFSCDNSNDWVDDTPRSDGPRFGCFANRPVQACNNAVMTENFMDYGDDKCITMFTRGQVDRMRQSILQYRKGLLPTGPTPNPTTTPPTPEPTPRPKGKGTSPTPKPTPKKKTPKKKTPKPTPKKATKKVKWVSGPPGQRVKKLRSSRLLVPSKELGRARVGWFCFDYPNRLLAIMA